MAGYVRQDTTNNIADGNVINALDLDNEYNAVEAAFNASTGHSHDGTSGEGAPITKVGPTQDVVVSTSSVTPKTNNVINIGSSLLRFKDLWLSGNSTIGGTLGVTGLITATGGVSGAVTSSNVTVTGGSINGTTIGASTASTGAFTTLTSSSTTTLNGTTIPASVTLVSTAATQTLTNKTISADNNTISGIAASSFVLSNGSGNIDGAAAQKAIPSGVVVGTTDAQTLTNKTLTAPVIATIVNTGTLTLPTSTDTLVGRATTDTLTNKTISGSNNTLSNIGNASLTNSSITFGSTAQALGSTVSALNGVSIGASTASTGAFTNLSYTGTLTGGTGVVNLGSGQVIKDASGNVGIGITPTQKLHVSGNILATGSIDCGMQFLGLATDTATAPSFSFTSDTDTGMFRPGTDQVALTTGGTARLTVTTAQFTGTLPWRGQNGTAAAPALSASGDTNTGIYFPAADTIGFVEGGVEAMRIDSAGNVGIGTSSPAQRLDLSGNAAVSGQIMAGTTTTYSDGSIGTPRLQWHARAGTYVGAISIADTSNFIAHWVLRNTNGNIADIGTNGTSLTLGTANAERMRIDSAGNVGIGTSSPNASYKLHVQGNILATGNLRIEGTQLRVAGSSSAAAPSIQPGEDGDTGMFWPGSNTIGLSTGGTERMRIDSSGNLLVGTTSAISGSTEFQVVNASLSSTQIRIRHSDAASGRHWRYGADSGNTVYIINQDSTGVYLNNGSTSWLGLSDERHKDIIEPIENAVEKVSSLRAVIGKFKTDEEGTRRSFLIAQDVQAVFPEAVDANNPDRLGVAYTDVIPLLVAAIKELKAELDTVKAELQTLKGN